MKYPFHIVDVFRSTPFGGNQLAVLPDAIGISTEGMQKIAREFNFGETTFVLPKNDPANTCRVRIFTPRTELDFAGHPSIGTAVMLPISFSSREIYGMAASSVLARGRLRPGSKKILRRAAPVPLSLGPWHRSLILAGGAITFRSSKASRWGVAAKLKRRLVRAGAS